jgi:hypothetical protein
MVGNIIR